MFLTLLKSPAIIGAVAVAGMGITAGIGKLRLQSCQIDRVQAESDIDVIIAQGNAAIAAGRVKFANSLNEAEAAKKEAAEIIRRNKIELRKQKKIQEAKLQEAFDELLKNSDWPTLFVPDDVFRVVCKPVADGSLGRCPGRVFSGPGGIGLDDGADGDSNREQPNKSGTTGNAKKGRVDDNSNKRRNSKTPRRPRTVEEVCAEAQRTGVPIGIIGPDGEPVDCPV